MNRIPSPRKRREAGATAMVFAIVIAFGVALALPAAQVSGGQTDTASASGSVNLDQCANLVPGCAWQNGSLNGDNAAYAESRVVPFRLAMEGLTPGEHSIVIDYDFTAGGHKAYDFLATYNASETVDLCGPGGGGVSSLCPSLPVPDTETMPADPFAADGLSVSALQTLSTVGRDLTVFGGTILSVSEPAHDGSTGGNSHASLVVRFYASGSAVLLAWGGHLAPSSYWDVAAGGAADGALTISGAPWHMRTMNLDGGGAANQDRSINPSALSGQPTATATAVPPTDTATPTNTAVPPTATIEAAHIELIAGKPGEPGFAGDGLPAGHPDVRLNQPHGMFETFGNDLYVADTGNDRIRKISPNSPSGIISTVAGGGTGSCGGGETNALGDGCPATDAILAAPADVHLDLAGNMYIADTNHCRIRRVDGATQIITTIVGTGVCGFGFLNPPPDERAVTAQLNHPRGVASDAGGNVYIADTDNHRIRKVHASGVIETLAGDGIPGDRVLLTTGDSGFSYLARVNAPHDVYLAARGQLLIADTGNHKVRRIFLQSSTIVTVAGTGTAGYSGDGGPATVAELNSPEAVSADSIGNVFIADTGNNVIRYANFDSGRIVTLAGSGPQGASGDGGPPQNATLDGPAGIAFGSVSLSDTDNSTLRGVEGDIDPITGAPRSGFQNSTSCVARLASAATVDWLLPLLPLGMVLGRKRLGHLAALIAFLLRGPRSAPGGA